MMEQRKEGIDLVMEIERRTGRKREKRLSEWTGVERGIA